MKAFIVPIYSLFGVLALAAGANQRATATCDANADARSLCNAETELTEALRRNDASGLYVLRQGRWRLVSSQITPMLN